MCLWTVNGRFIGHVTCEHMISCLDFSGAPEGISVNVIATGLSNGAIRYRVCHYNKLHDIRVTIFVGKVNSFLYGLFENDRSA